MPKKKRPTKVEWVHLNSVARPTIPFYPQCTKMTAMLHPSLQTVIDNLDDVAPYCIGSVPLDATNSKLFYQSDQSRTEILDFTKVTDEQLYTLARACGDPASLTYHGGCKMDVSRFATHFSPFNSGILNIVSDILLRGQIPVRAIRSELSELSICGPGDFRKAPVNTPRSDAMFGTLLVVFPTVHDGSVVIHCNGKQLNVNSSQVIPPHAAFVAFVSIDAEHEVMPVFSGYRVSLTYNLLLNGMPNANIADIARFRQSCKKIANPLEALLEDTTFFPDGGLLGFGLAYRYPFSQATTNLSDLAKWLKGSDAALKRACKRAALINSVQAVYHCDGEAQVLVDHFVKFGVKKMELGMVDHLGKKEDGVVIYDSSESISMVWVRPLTGVNTFTTNYAPYGNEAPLSSVDGELCLVVEIPPNKDRGFPPHDQRRTIVI